MATIVVHGTMTTSAARNARWWWDSWDEHGFLDALSFGMEHVSGGHDVWRVAGRPVSEVPELQTKWNLWNGTRGQVSSHKGHFTWSGANMGAARDAGASQLAAYLNRVADLTDEPIRIVAHSHGCNVVKAASSHRKLSRHVRISRAVFLACPHFAAEGSRGPVFTYQLDPRRFDHILNLYSEEDSVQVGLADAITGPAGSRFADWLPPTAHRIDLDRATAGKYENAEVPTAAHGVLAHTVMHGALVGGLAGMWLGGRHSFQQIVQQASRRLPQAVPANDVGV